MVGRWSFLWGWSIFRFELLVLGSVFWDASHWSTNPMMNLDVGRYFLHLAKFWDMRQNAQNVSLQKGISISRGWFWGSVLNFRVNFNLVEFHYFKMFLFSLEPIQYVPPNVLLISLMPQPKFLLQFWSHSNQDILVTLALKVILARKGLDVTTHLALEGSYWFDFSSGVAVCKEGFESENSPPPWCFLCFCPPSEKGGTVVMGSLYPGGETG